MSHEQQPPQDDAAEREWALQEQALRAERLGLDPSNGTKLRTYRTVVRALRHPLDENLPPEFAAQMAAQVQPRRIVDMRLELWLSGALLGALAAMMAGLLVMCGPTWLQLVQAAMKSYGLINPWLLAVVVCISLPAAAGKLISNHTTSR